MPYDPDDFTIPDDDALPTTDTKPALLSSPRTHTTSGAMVLSFIALLVGVLALGLAAIPAVAFQRILPNPLAESKIDQRPVEKPVEREGGVTFKFRSMSINVGGKPPKKEQPALTPPVVTRDPMRWYTVAANVSALIGLVVGAIGHLRERHTVLTLSSMGCCAAAITWQYFAIGIAIGAAAAAFLIVLAILGSALG